MCIFSESNQDGTVLGGDYWLLSVEDHRQDRILNQDCTRSPIKSYYIIYMERDKYFMMNVSYFCFFLVAGVLKLSLLLTTFSRSA